MNSGILSITKQQANCLYWSWCFTVWN